MAVHFRIVGGFIALKISPSEESTDQHQKDRSNQKKRALGFDWMNLPARDGGGSDAE